MKRFTYNLENGFVRITYHNKVPKGVRKGDTIQLELFQDGEYIFNHFLFPDEAFLISHALITGVLYSKEGIYPEHYKKQNYRR